MEFAGLSRVFLQEALLKKLALVNDLERSIRDHRRHLYQDQKELAATKNELAQIEAQLERILPFPQTNEPVNAATNKVTRIDRRRLKKQA